jgi:hypothetical protein
VEVDLSRPPAHLGPRAPIWVTLAVVYGASFVVYVVSLGLLNQPGSTSVAEVLVVFAVAATAVMFYAQARLFQNAGSLAGAQGVASSRDGATPEDRRPADPDEREALRQLRRGRIPRREYERIIAYRHVVHGEISRPEYHEVLRQLGYDHPAVRERSDGSS